jgi:signal transduction histidine kinase
MGNGVRVKLIGDDPELDRVEIAAAKAEFSFARFRDLDDACESQPDDPAEVFVIGPSLYYQTHLNQLQKLSQRPEVVLASGPRLPNLAKILIPHMIYNDWSDEEISRELKQAAEFYRRSRRLEALRDHHKRSWNLDANPAINLVTNLMRKCTVAEEYRDLLAAMLSLKNVIDFHDASLLILDGEDRISEAWHSARELKDRIQPLDEKTLPAGAMPGDLPDGAVSAFSSSSESPWAWDTFTTHPWSFGIALRFSQGQALRQSKTRKSAVLVLYRRELLPFQERDFWLLEMTYGPLALALEKVATVKAIGQASKEWRSTFDGISEPLTVIDSNYQIVKANRAFARLVDQDIKKLKTKRCYTLLANRRTPCVGCPLGMETQPQGGTRIQWQGKNKKDLLVWSYGIRTGMEAYHFQFYRNVSKETMLASTLIQSEKMAALGRLVGAVAHEINNPLAGILATSQILLKEADEGGMDATVKEDMEEIRSAAWRSKKIIDDLLGFTAGGERPLEHANLLEVIRSTLTFSKAALKDALVSVDSDEPEPLAFVPVNALQQVLFNLITNAAQAMNGKGNLVIEVRRMPHNYRIHVRDSGPGIPADKVKHIFDPFFTSKQEGVGTGLGLSIVRNLTHKMGARIEVESTVGKGTEFTLFLPITPKPELNT